MSHTLSLPHFARRAMLLTGLPVLLALGSAFPAASQTAGRDSSTAGSSPRKGRGPISPIAPAILRDSIGVTGSKLEQYTRRYSSHMAGTRPARDSLRNAMQAMRAAGRNGDHSPARERRASLREQFQGLAKRDQQFEASLKDLLTQDQQNRYAQWKETQRDLARKHWHREHHNRGGDESRPRG
jgi:hypothetical protein